MQEIKLQEAIKVAEKETTKLAENSRIKVISQPTFDSAREQLKTVKTIKKSVKEKKESITKPLNEALKNTRALFLPVEEKIGLIENFLNDGILKYNRILIAEQKKRDEEAAEKLRIEEEKKAEAEAEVERLRLEAEKKEKAGEEVSEEDKAKLEEVEQEVEKEIDMDKITKKSENTAEKIDQIRTRKVKKYRIIDATKIPREYLQVDEKLVKESMNLGQPVEGIEFYTEEIAVNRY